MLTYLNYLELELTNSKRILIENDWDKVYDIHEIHCHSLKFTKTFPFISFVEKMYTSFKFRTQYATLNSYFDPKYKVNCSLLQLTKMFGAKVKSFEKMCIENDLNDIS